MTDANNTPNNNANNRPQPEYGAYADDAAQQSAQSFQYGQPTAGANGNPYANPYADQTSNPYANQAGPYAADPFKLIEDSLPATAKNVVRGVYGVIGVAAVALGAALLFWPKATLSTAAILLGIYFVISGVVRVVTAFVEIGLPGGWRVLDVLIGILLTLGGVMMLKNAVLSGQTLAVFVTLAVGFGWMMEGFMALIESWRLPSSGWAVLYAILSIVAGFVVLLSPLDSTVWLVIFAAVSLMVMGVVAIIRAFTFGKSSK